MSIHDIYLGIDPTAGRRPATLAALDDDLRVVHLGPIDANGIVAFVESHPGAVVAVDAPQSPKRGLMRRPEVRRRFGLPVRGRTFGEWKICEYELRRRNLRITSTPSKAGAAPSWMRAGFALYQRLTRLGFAFFRHGDPPPAQMMVEVHPHASFAVLLGHRPLLKANLEGRLQRQMVLYLEGLDLRNPVHTLEEITRQHLLSGSLPLDGLHNHDELDALVAAFTAYLVHQKPSRVCQVGEPKEGLITLPAASLKDRYD
jgi:predicted nuclease with RNAse H fold